MFKRFHLVSSRGQMVMARKEMDSIGICATEVMMGFFFQPSKVRLMMMTDPTAPIMTTISHTNLAIFPVVDSPKK